MAVKGNQQPRPTWFNGTRECACADTSRLHVRIPEYFFSVRLHLLGILPLPWPVEEYLRSHEWCATCAPRCIRFFEWNSRSHDEFKAVMRSLGMNPDHASYIWKVTHWHEEEEAYVYGQSDEETGEGLEVDDEEGDEARVAAQIVDDAVPSPA